MRIIAGIYRGKKMCAPEGESTRPTSDRAREALFNIIDSKLVRIQKTWNDVVVLDGFAGTGAVGVEALSRGAKKGFFIESDKSALACLKKNMVAGGEIIADDISKIKSAKQACDFVFLDPPYKKGLVEKALDVLDKAGWIADDAIIVAEVEKKEEISIDNFDVVEERIYGVAKFLFLARREK